MRTTPLVAAVFASGVIAACCCEKKPEPATAHSTHATPSEAPAAAAPPAEPTPAPTPTPAPAPAPAPAPPPDPQPAVRTLPSGVVVEDLKLGDGPEAALSSTVLVHYRGTLKTGEQFDATDPKGPPIEFPLAGLIQGWQEGIPGMRPGGVRRLTIPAAMAYGPREIRDDAGEVIIPPNSDLVFEITLVGVK